MRKNRKLLKVRVLFNASVILSGLKSLSGGSSRLMDFAKKRKISGVISEIILDEALKNSYKIDLSQKEVLNFCKKIFSEVSKAPDMKIVNSFKKTVVDEGDAHILATCRQEKIRYLVTLDKKHLLILKGKIKGLKILTPGELIEFLATRNI